MSTQPPLNSCDVLISAGTVIDGTGAPRFDADVAIVGERIAAVGDLSSLECATCIDAAGRIVAPGFIDSHTHDDRALLSTPDMTYKVSQGVTTVIAGNCGISLAPLDGVDPPPPLNLLGGREWYRFASAGDYLDAVEAASPAVNAAFLLGHSTLRIGTMADLGRPASTAQRERMGALVEDALAAGYIGLSMGLDYPPARSAPTAELIELCAHLAGYEALCTVHMRDEGNEIVSAIEEALAIGRAAGVPVVISHLKVSGRANWGRAAQVLELLSEARRRQTVHFDAYPYIASSTVLLPHYAAEAERVLIAWSTPHPELAGRTLDDIRNAWGCGQDDAIERLSPAGAIYESMHETDLRTILGSGAMIGSDGLPHDVFPHPRLWGTFPRVLGHYARDIGLLTLEQAVHAMSGATAAAFKLPDRGIVAAGAHADLVVFDPGFIIDKADFEAPMQAAQGIDLVVVNGAPVWRDGAHTGARPGRVLKRP